MSEKKFNTYIDESDYDVNVIKAHNRKPHIIKKLIIAGIATAALIGGGKFVYDKVSEYNENNSPDPYREVINYHEQNDDFKNLIIDVSKVLEVKNQDLEKINFYKTDNNDLVVTTKVQTSEHWRSGYKEYIIPNVETDNFEEIIEIIKNYDFSKESKTTLELSEAGCFREVYNQVRSSSENIKNLLNDNYSFETSFDTYYSCELDEDYNYQTFTIGGWYKFSKGSSVKYIHYEYTADVSNVGFHEQNIYKYIASGDLDFKEVLFREMDQNYGKSRYLGNSGFVNDFTDAEDYVY